MTLDDQVAELLEDGATYQQIEQQLRVDRHRIRRVRAARRIPLPPGRVKRSRAELDALEPKVIAMLLAGAMYKEIRKETRYSLNEIARLRRELNIPVPGREPTGLTIDEALTRYALPCTTGDHVVWQGPTRGRTMTLLAEGQRFNVRYLLFERAHGRPHVGYVVSNCGLIPCIAGAHLTDSIIRGTGGRR
ncbi:hypothetical protein AB0896_27415 [Streptomyces parvulus]|uniref:hypothetical protein n=1 Tax=Streptomyces parvulus TaxID=146923 RepID=UPI003453EE2D